MLRVFYSLLLVLISMILSISHQLLFLILLTLIVIIFPRQKSPREVCLFLFTYKKVFPVSKNFMHITEKKDFIFKYTLNVWLIMMQSTLSGIFVNQNPLYHTFLKSMNELNRYSYCTSGFINLCHWHSHLQRVGNWKHIFWVSFMLLSLHF